MPAIAYAIDQWSADGHTIKISSLLWARLLLAHSEVVFADGATMKYRPATLVSAQYEEVTTGSTEFVKNANLPGGGVTIDNRATFKGVTFVITGDNLRVRVRAYHRADGKEFGHPGVMRLACPDTREWDEVYKMVQGKLNKLKPTISER
jgi:hypothetical protein